MFRTLFERHVPQIAGRKVLWCSSTARQDGQDSGLYACTYGRSNQTDPFTTKIQTEFQEIETLEKQKQTIELVRISLFQLKFLLNVPQRNSTYPGQNKVHLQ